MFQLERKIKDLQKQKVIMDLGFDYKIIWENELNKKEEHSYILNIIKGTI